VEAELESARASRNKSPFVLQAASTVQGRPATISILEYRGIHAIRRPVLGGDIDMCPPGRSLDVERETGKRGVGSTCAWPAKGLPKRKQGFKEPNNCRASKSPPTHHNDSNRLITYEIQICMENRNVLGDPIQPTNCYKKKLPASPLSDRRGRALQRACEISPHSSPRFNIFNVRRVRVKETKAKWLKRSLPDYGRRDQPDRLMNLSRRSSRPGSNDDDHRAYEGSRSVCSLASLEPPAFPPGPFRPAPCIKAPPAARLRRRLSASTHPGMALALTLSRAAWKVISRGRSARALESCYLAPENFGGTNNLRGSPASKPGLAGPAGHPHKRGRQQLLIAWG